MERYKALIPILIKLVIVAVVLLALYFIGLPILAVLAPFIIAGLVAILMEPVVKFTQNKLKMKRSISSLLSLLAFLAVFGTIIVFAVYKIIVELIDLSLSIPVYFKSININNELSYLNNLSQKFYLSIPPEAATLLQTKLGEAVNTISAYLTSIVSSILAFALNFVISLPETFVFIIITILSTYFISSDKEKIKEFIFKQVPDSWAPKILGLKNDLIFAFIGFLKAQLILILVSMFIASTGLTILGVKYAIIMGIIIGIAELIPVVGTGSIFVPWIIYHFATKDIHTAVGLLCIFLLGVLIRQLIEPKIIGVQVGIYPLVALIAIYVGLSLFGVFGMILGPIIVILIKNLNSSGIIRLWKE